MFAFLTSILLIPAQITNILFKNRKGSVFGILEQLLYIVIGLDYVIVNLIKVNVL